MLVTLGNVSLFLALAFAAWAGIAAVAGARSGREARCEADGMPVHRFLFRRA